MRPEARVGIGQPGGALREQGCIVRKKAVDAMLAVQEASTIGSTSISAISSASTSSGGAFSAAPSSFTLSSAGRGGRRGAQGGQTGAQGAGTSTQEL